MSDNSYFNPQTNLLFSKRLEAVINFPAVSTTLTGTNGAPALAVSSYTTFVDATAAAFTKACVGQTLICTGGSHSANDGVFLITGYTSATTITIYNPAGVVDTSVTWHVQAQPNIVSGDINNAYMTIEHVGPQLGKYTITTVDGYPAGSFTGCQFQLIPSTGQGNWHIEAGCPVQNIGGFHPFYGPAQLTTPNSWSIPFVVYSTTTATNLIPTTVTATGNGAPTTTTAGTSYCTFIDATANTFTQSMVGSPITISADATNATNNGTFTILAFVSASTVIISNNAGVATTGLSWSVTLPAQVAIEVVMNNGTAQ